MAEQRNRKGTVAVHSLKGVLRLAWSYLGKRFYLYCGLADTPLNRIVAEGKAKIIEGDLATGNFDPSLAKYKPERQNQITGTELFERFTERKAKQIYDRTLPKYKALLARLQEFFGNKSAIAISETDAEKFKEALTTRMSAATLRERIGLLKACWDWGIKKKLITENPWTDIKIRVPPKQKPHPFTSDEIQKILMGFSDLFPHYVDFVEFLFGTGVRTGEAIALQWKHINNDCSAVWIGESVSRGRRQQTKTGRDRTIFLTLRLQQMLLARRPEGFCSEDLIFPAPQGKTIDDHNFRNRAWQPVLDAVGIPYRKPYTTRHTLVSHAIERGMNPVNVAELTGHNVKTLYQHYAGSISKPKLPDIFSSDDP